MGFLIGIFKRIFIITVYLALFIAVITLIPNLPPYTNFTSIKIEPTQPRVGALAPNGALNNAEHLYKGKLLGPEALHEYNGEIYTGLATGEIVKISPGGHVTFVTKIGQPCKSKIEDHICGRPLGFVIDEKKKLIYVADAYHGIWKVNLVTDKKQVLVPSGLAISGRTPKLFNSVALDKNGDLYWTDSSSDYHLNDGVMATLSDPSGRLFYYNAAKNESKVLLDDLWFPNGVVISPDNQFLVIAETARYRLLKYYINGPKKGSSEVFIAGVPGLPDTVRTLPDGSGILLSLYDGFDDDHPMLSKTMAAVPFARKFIVRVFRLIENSAEFLNTQYSHHIFDEIVHYIGSFTSVMNMNPGMPGLLQIDWNGKIIASYFNTDGSLRCISDAVVFNDKLYTACPQVHDYIGAVPVPALLKKAFSTNKPDFKEQPNLKVSSSEQVKHKAEEKKEIPKVSDKIPKQQQPKPTIEKQSEQKVKESPVKQNTVPKESPTNPKPVSKDAAEKPKMISKEAEVKPKVVPKEAEVKPKVVSKEAEVKPKVVTKEAEIKQKVVTKEAEVKPKVVSKEPPVKQKQPEAKPQPALKEQVKAKDSLKDTGKKHSETKTKPDTIETVTEPKPSKEAYVKSETVTKESVQAKPVPKEVKQNPTAKSEEQKTSQKSNVNKQKTEESTKKASTDSKSKSTESGSKPIPVEEEIPSDTAKPNKETLKVIKKSGPQEIPNPNL